MIQPSGQIDFNNPQPDRNSTSNSSNSSTLDTAAPSAQSHEVGSDEPVQLNRENSAVANQINQDPNTTNKQEQKLEAAINSSTKNLFHIKSFSLLKMFQSEVIIDVTKISFIIRKFLTPKQTVSVAIQDIVEVEVSSVPFFATLTLQTVMTDESNHIIQVTHLNKEEAQKARRIIQGLEIAMKQGIDLTQIKDDRLLNRIQELGETTPEYGQNKTTPDTQAKDSN